MLRVLMVLDDYGELMFLQTVLKKLGFDVDAIQNPRQLADSLLSMNPDILVMTAHGKRVRGLDMIQNVRRLRGLPRVILLRGPGVAQDPTAEVDGWLESPVPALTLLNMIADLAGLNKQVLADKFQKLHMQEIENEKSRMLKTQEEEGQTLDLSKTDSGNFGDLTSTMPAGERRERYQKFLREEPPKESGFANKQVADHVRTLRQQEGGVDHAELERERKAFVEHLFKKKSE